MDIFIFDNERKFEIKDKDDKAVKLKVVKPTQEQISNADLRYKQKFSQALRGGAMTRAQAEIFIKKNDLVDADTLARRDEVLLEINNLRNQLADKDKKTDGIAIIKQINEYRTELENINNISMDIMNQTAESYADDFRIQWLCCELTQNEDDTNYFKDYEDFATRINETSTIDIVKNVILFLNNLKDNFEMEYEENKWLLDKQIMNDDGTINFENLLEDGEKTDIEVPEKKTKSKPKTKSKKTTAKKKNKK